MYKYNCVSECFIAIPHAEQTCGDCMSPFYQKLTKIKLSARPNLLKASICHNEWALTTKNEQKIK